MKVWSNYLLLAWTRTFIGRVLGKTRITLAGGSRQICPDA